MDMEQGTGKEMNSLGVGTTLGNNKVVTVQAPASVGNVAVGFDVLGHSLQGMSDTVMVERSEEPGVRVVEVSGLVKRLPTSSRGNTAAAAVAAMAKGLGLEDAGFDIRLNKGIPLSSGMGGSAASAVGAVVAVNNMLKIPMPQADLYGYALAGEAVASGSAHGDNVAASLLGGLTLASVAEEPGPVQLKVPNRLRCAVVHPHVRIETKEAREMLPKSIPMETVVAQSANFGALIAACYERDIDRIAHALKDLMIEPRRAKSIPGFSKVKQAALDAGALGCSISGAGPSVFAWFVSDSGAAEGAESMVAAFAAAGIESDVLISPISGPGARVI
jgi:homoserine kinase